MDMIKLPLTNTLLPEEEVSVLGERFGTPIEKGVVYTQRRILNHVEDIKDKMQFYSVYPDLYLDEILTPTDSSFELLFSQRVFLRAMLRYQVVHLTAARGFSKTFIAILAYILMAIFKPGSQIAITAPSKSQAAEIAGQKIQELLTRFPLLREELMGGVAQLGKDYAILKFKNGSVIEITAALETTRGRRFSGLMCDELRDQDGDKVNSILLPTLVISRRTAGKGILNPHENHQAQIFTTSASSKSSFNYQTLIDTFIKGIIEPEKFIAFGIDYRVPVKEGLISNDYITQMKLSPTFKEGDFAREFLSIYTSDNEESWFNFTQLNKHRKIINSEWSPKLVKDQEQFYLLSVDVGRLHDQTVCEVYKVSIRNRKYHSRLVNIFILGRTAKTRPFSVQVTDMKKIIRAFNPLEVVIDINGLGISVADEMIRTHYDEYGLELPPLGFKNSDDYKKIQPVDAPLILWGIKANGPLNSQMFGNAYSRISSGMVDFLITEQEARTKMLSTKKGQKMSVEQKMKHLMPYEMTTKLFEEMGNLRMKRTGASLDIVLEQINPRFSKDKFSSMIMALWRIKELEDEYTKRSRRNRAGRDMFFYTERRG